MKSISKNPRMKRNNTEWNNTNCVYTQYNTRRSLSTFSINSEQKKLALGFISTKLSNRVATANHRKKRSISMAHTSVSYYIRSMVLRCGAVSFVNTALGLCSCRPFNKQAKLSFVFGVYLLPDFLAYFLVTGYSDGLPACRTPALPSSIDIFHCIELCFSRCAMDLVGFFFRCCNHAGRSIWAKQLTQNDFYFQFHS